MRFLKCHYERVKMNIEITKLFEKAYNNVCLTKEECMQLLALEDASPEAVLMRGVASDIIRRKTGNTGAIFGQIGFECSPCSGNCQFCSFAKDYTMMPTINMCDEAIAEATRNFTGGDDLYCWRLGEGKDTVFSSEQRKQTIMNAKEAGLEVLDALEPIGVEHTVEEMAEHIMFSMEMGVTQCGAMKRIPVPGTPFENIPAIGDFTLSKYIAAMVITMAGMENFPWMGTHEPHIQGYMSGANMISAETGVNPRDTAEETSTSRGLDVPACKEHLKEAGYEYVARGNGTKMAI